MPNRVVVSRLALLVLMVLLAAILLWSPAATGQSVRQQAADCRLYIPMVGNQFITYFDGPNEVEPNDTYLQANGSIRSGVNYQGYPNDQRDWFSFHMPLAGQINITLNNHTGQGVQLQLFYQNTGNLVTFDTDDPYHISHTGAAGWYYIYIFTAANTNSDTLYTLNATYIVPPTSMPVTPVATPTCPAVGSPTPTATATVAVGWYEVGEGSATSGGISDNTGSSRFTSIAITGEDTAYIAWEDNSSGDTEIYVRRWNGSGWEEVGVGSASGGGISNNSENSTDPSVAVAPDGTPYATWHDNSSGNGEVYVRRWNGSGWEEVGAGSAIGGGISNSSGTSNDPAVAVAPDGTVYITWTDTSDGDAEIYVRRWNGSSWEEVGLGSATGGGISNNNDTSNTPSIAIALDGTPYIAWSDDYGNPFGTLADSSGKDKEIYVRRWNGSSWEEVGTGSAIGGGISDNDGNSHAPSITVAADGTPYIAWRDDSSGNTEIYVRRWNGNNWEEVGAGSATDNGISNSSGDSVDPRIAIMMDDTPIVAWHDDSSGNHEIYVRWWNSSSWEEVGIGSATGGGISNNNGNSRWPSIAIALNGIPYVTWDDNTSTNFGFAEIYVRRWMKQVR